jgi:hypothetical protein
MENYMDTITEVISFLRSKFTIHDFEYLNDKLFCKDTRESFNPDELKINRIYRFEGDSSVDDMSILYYLESYSGTKGILIDAFGTYGNAPLEEFISKIPDIIDIV